MQKMNASCIKGGWTWLLLRGGGGRRLDDGKAEARLRLRTRLRLRLRTERGGGGGKGQGKRGFCSFNAVSTHFSCSFDVFVGWRT